MREAGAHRPACPRSPVPLEMQCTLMSAGRRPAHPAWENDGHGQRLVSMHCHKRKDDGRDQARAVLGDSIPVLLTPEQPQPSPIKLSDSTPSRYLSHHTMPSVALHAIFDPKPGPSSVRSLPLPHSEFVDRGRAKTRGVSEQDAYDHSRTPGIANSVSLPPIRPSARGSRETECGPLPGISSIFGEPCVWQH